MNANELSTQLSDLVHSKIVEAREHCISFAEFMELALYAPGLGYYVAGKNFLSEQGDFVTAPEISPLFSRCIANQCRAIFAEIKNPNILELGAGTGRMAIDILESLREKESLPQNYFILEPSPSLQAAQKELIEQSLPDLKHLVQWLSVLPQNFRGLIVANEVMDAFPVNCFSWKSDQMRGGYFVENAVAYDETHSAFIWEERTIETGSPLEQALKTLPSENFSTGYRSEINLFLPAWIKTLSDSLDQGLILLMDYGFSRSELYHPERSGGSLMCHYQHAAHSDPFVNVGLQDLTAHVDFTAVVEAARQVNLKIEGYVNQANFLLNCDVLGEFESQMKSKEPFEQIAMQQGLRRLIEPHEMGELIKCIALSRGLEGSLMGFEKADRLASL